MSFFSAGICKFKRGSSEFSGSVSREAAEKAFGVDSQAVTNHTLVIIETICRICAKQIALHICIYADVFHKPNSMQTPPHRFTKGQPVKKKKKKSSKMAESKLQTVGGARCSPEAQKLS